MRRFYLLTISDVEPPTIRRLHGEQWQSYGTSGYPRDDDGYRPVYPACVCLKCEESAYSLVGGLCLNCFRAKRLAA